MKEIEIQKNKEENLENFWEYQLRRQQLLKQALRMIEEDSNYKEFNNKDELM